MAGGRAGVGGAGCRKHRDIYAAGEEGTGRNESGSVGDVRGVPSGHGHSCPGDADRDERGGQPGAFRVLATEPVVAAANDSAIERGRTASRVPARVGPCATWRCAPELAGNVDTGGALVQSGDLVRAGPNASGSRDRVRCLGARTRRIHGSNGLWSHDLEVGERAGIGAPGTGAGRDQRG